jgi:hypothetical protein
VGTFAVALRLLRIHHVKAGPEEARRKILRQQAGRRGIARGRAGFTGHHGLDFLGEPCIGLRSGFAGGGGAHGFGHLKLSLSDPLNLVARAREKSRVSRTRAARLTHLRAVV